MQHLVEALIHKIEWTDSKIDQKMWIKDLKRSQKNEMNAKIEKKTFCDNYERNKEGLTECPSKFFCF
jgi:hypothetical protein